MEEITSHMLPYFNPINVDYLVRRVFERSSPRPAPMFDDELSVYQISNQLHLIPPVIAQPGVFQQ